MKKLLLCFVLMLSLLLASCEGDLTVTTTGSADTSESSSTESSDTSASSSLEGSTSESISQTTGSTSFAETTETTKTPDVVVSPHADKLTYELNSDGRSYTVVGRGTLPDGEAVVIPSHYKGLPVTAIGESAFYGVAITNVTIPETVEVIGAGAFGETFIHSLYLPDSVKEIGERAFISCVGLVEARLPKGLRVISARLFARCYALATVDFPDELFYVGAEAFDQTNLTETAYDTGVYYGDAENPYLILHHVPWEATWCNIHPDTVFIEHGALGSPHITELIIPEGVRGIGTGVFGSRLEKLTLPESLQYLGLNNFASKPLALTPYGDALYIGNEENPYLVLVKAKDTAITSISVHEKTRIIAAEAFENCRSLTTVTLPSGLVAIGEEAFRATSISSLDLPASLLSIGKQAFVRCAELKSLSVFVSLVHIGDRAFIGLTDFTLHCPAGSFAERYARENEVAYSVYED